MYSFFKVCNFFSDYKVNATINVNNRHYPPAEAGDGVIKSIWLLLLAMLFKAVITVFTFGIKVFKKDYMILMLNFLISPPQFREYTVVSFRCRIFNRITGCRLPDQLTYLSEKASDWLPLW